MLCLITKASDDDYYEIKEVNTLEEMLQISPDIIVGQNLLTSEEARECNNWRKQAGEENFYKEEDVPLFDEIEVELMIHDSYIY